MPQPVVVRWAVREGLPRLALRTAARRGELAARMAVEPTLRADPFEAYEQLRAQGDLVRGSVTHATSTHAVVDEVLRDSTRFGVGVEAAFEGPVLGRLLKSSVDPRAVGPVEPPSMLAVDPPDHTRYRRLVTKVFSARAVAGLASEVETIADELLGRMSGRVDLVDAYAGALPVAVIGNVLGIPQEMHAQLLQWGERAAMTLDPGLSLGQYRQVQTALREMHAWLGTHLQTLRRDPGDDLLSQLAVLVDDGDRLTDVELRATALLVIAAGFETTVNLLGSGVVDLLAHPDQLERLRAEGGWDNAVEEVLRWDAPVQVTARVVQHPTELAGLPLERGKLLLLMLGGANRDPAVFDDPQRFDVTRRNAREHLAFSGGIHYCLGASLARLEGSVGLRMLLERFPDLALDGEPTRRPLRVLRGYSAVPAVLGAPSLARV